MDFFQIRTREPKRGSKVDLEIYADFEVGRSTDLMVRGKSFYAIWDEEKNLWSTDEYDVPRLVDKALREFAEKTEAEGTSCSVVSLRSFDSNRWSQFKKFLNSVGDNSHDLDSKLTFADTVVKKSDYVSRRLPYSLAEGNHDSWDELVSTLYTEEERAKFEWAIGAVISGDAKKIQKFLVFYGLGGTGKSTVMNVIHKMFGGLTSEGGYVGTFEAKALVGNNNAFATEAFKGNPLVGIQQDGDLSRIDDNTKFNSIVSHEYITINEKFKPSYSAKINAFLFMGTNKPVKISDAKSGIIRRLIDVRPTGNLIPVQRYNELVAQTDFELGAIAHHCLEVYRGMGKNFYNSYRPLEMMFQTDVFFNYIEANWDLFKEQDGTTLKQAYALYKEYCDDSRIRAEQQLPQYKFRSALMDYFETFKERDRVNGEAVRSYFSGFKPRPVTVVESEIPYLLDIDYTKSLLDLLLKDQPAQYAKGDGNPAKYWTNDERTNNDGELFTPKPHQVVSTTLADVDTTRLHFVKPPQNHIVIDFDLTDENGVKSLEKNLEAASKWKPTYAELSKSGSAVHLHYIYEGDVSKLSSLYSEGIEVKVFNGNASLRRKVSKCNNIPVSTINSGLPFKEAKMLSATTIKSDRGLRDLIERNLRKEIHPGTKPSVDFIKKILDDAHASGMTYDVTDMRPRIIVFAQNSSNQFMQCLETVNKMKFQSESIEEEILNDEYIPVADERVVYFDVEVYPNLFLICWGYEDDDHVTPMINPTPQETEGLLRFKLVGFNNRGYDNHMLYARILGYTIEQIYELSQKIIKGNRDAKFSEAYRISYADVWDYSSDKKSLKKFQIDLGLPHKEMDIPWDQPVPEDKLLEVVEYCCNDVRSTAAVAKDREQDFIARKILATLSGLTVNDTTPAHVSRIIFGGDRNPQKSFVYTDLSREFPGYTYEFGKSHYRGEITGEGGYVYAEPGMYTDVALLDIASMHPASIQSLNLFGPYTERFIALKDARLAIKHRDFETARKMLDGKLAPFLGQDLETMEGDELKTALTPLSDALKLAINTVYGLTYANFDNPFRDPRNKDNIVAKRGALFMVDLKHFVQERGFTVAHIKTDSIKIPNATPEIIAEVMEFGKKYGYDFEYDPTKDFYDKLCLVNESTYIAKQRICLIDIWTAVGAQFQVPYVYKTLFSHEPITFDDLCITKEVKKGALYLDFDSLHPMPGTELGSKHFIGRTGRFVPVVKEVGAILYRVLDDKEFAPSGTKGYYFLEASMAKGLPDSVIDMSYFETLADKAKKKIEEFGDFYEFTDSF